MAYRPDGLTTSLGGTSIPWGSSELRHDWNLRR